MKTAKCISIFVLVLLARSAWAQTPLNDTAWVLQTSLSDEFSSLNLTLWDTSYYTWTPGAISNVLNGADWDFGRNDSVAGGYLYMKADTLKPNKVAAWNTYPDYGYGVSGQSLTYAYQGAVLKSKNPSYQYGYIEARMKMPSKKYALWPAFWMWSANCTQGVDFLNEIDIAENDATQSFQGNKVGNNYHISDTTCSYDYALNSGNSITVPVDSLSGSFHKFAFEWDPHSMTYYFDDAPTLSKYDPNGTSIPQQGMTLIFDFAIDPYYAKLPSDWIPPGNNVNNPHFPTKWPQRLQVDYVRYYKLLADCSIDLLNLSTPSGYDRKVKHKIATNTSSPPTFSPADKATSYVLRATDSVLLDAGATINSPTGTGYFAIEIIACPQ